MGRTETATFCPNEVAADDEAEPKTATFCPNEVGADDKTCAENGVRKSGPVCRSPDKTPDKTVNANINFSLQCL